MANQSINQCGVFHDRVLCPTLESAQELARTQEAAFMDVMGGVALDRFEEAPAELSKNRVALDQIAKQVQNPVGWFFAKSLAVTYGAASGFGQKSVEIAAGLPMFVGAVVSGDMGIREMIVGMKDMGLHAYENLDHAWDAAKAGRLSEATYLASGSVTDFAMLGEGAAGASRLVKVGIQKARAAGEAMANMVGGDGGALATVSSAGSITLLASVPAIAVASAGGSDFLPIAAAMATHEGGGTSSSGSITNGGSFISEYVNGELERVIKFQGLLPTLRARFAIAKLLKVVEANIRKEPALSEVRQWRLEAQKIYQYIATHSGKIMFAKSLQVWARKIERSPMTPAERWDFSVGELLDNDGGPILKTPTSISHLRVVKPKWPIMTDVNGLPERQSFKYLVQEDAEGIPRIRYDGGCEVSHSNLVDGQGKILGAGYMNFDATTRRLYINGYSSGFEEAGKTGLPSVKRMIKEMFGDGVTIEEVGNRDLGVW